VLIESHKQFGMRYHIQDADGADVQVLCLRDNPDAEETAAWIVEKTNAGK
jgi:hypothetical protein